jgi:hypothetical protein
VAEDETGGIAAPSAPRQQILVHALRQIKSAAGHVVARLP